MIKDDIQRQNRPEYFQLRPACGFDLHGNDAFMHDENVGSGGNSRGVQYTQKPGSLCNVVFNAAAV